MTDQCEDVSTKKVSKISSAIMRVFQLTETGRGELCAHHSLILCTVIPQQNGKNKYQIIVSSEGGGGGVLRLNYKPDTDGIPHLTIIFLY